MKTGQGRHSAGTVRRLIRGVIGVAAMGALLAAGIVGFGSSAVAAGTATLNVSISPVDPSNASKSSAVAGDTVGYVVQYSCLAEDCTNVTVALPTTQTDPNGFGKQLLAYSSWTAPFPGATMNATGTLATLGTITAGTSASFTVYYMIEAVAPGYTTDSVGEFFPDGFQIQNSVTISSDSATGPVTANAAPVTWHNAVPTPATNINESASSVAPGQQVTYSLYMSSGVWVSGGSGRIVGSGGWVGAGSYVVVDQLPAEATFVSASAGYIYDAAAHTVTWSLGSPSAPDVGAAGGWGSTSLGGWSARGDYGPRSITVSYPASAFPDADPSGCNFTATVTNSLTATLSYLDPAKTQKITNTSAASTAVSCYSPFGRSTTQKDSTSDASSGATRLVNVPPDVAGLTCPTNGFDQWGRACTAGAALAPFADNLKAWSVVVRNAGNVPGVAMVDDQSLDQADAPVYQIAASVASTIAYSYQCGTDPVVTGSATGTSFALTTAQRSSGCRITGATITSGSVAAGNARPTDTGAGTAFTAAFAYAVTTTAPVGQTRTNTATGTMTYPGYTLADVTNTASHTIQFRAQPLGAAPAPTFTAGFPAAAAVDGGGNAVPGRDVTFTVRGASANIPVAGTITPEYVFIAPTGWTIDPGSASFPPGTVPDGVDFSYQTVTLAGVQRQAVIATWPTGTDFGENATWPTMSVVAQPGSSVAPNTTSVATAWIGDSQDQYTNTTATFAAAVQDTGDVDGNGSTTDWFSSSTQSVVVFSSSGLSVVKEICQLDLLQADGCDWISDPDTVVPVAPDATDIGYRITLRNTGNTPITNAVGYDVLPYVGDTGLTTGTRGTPRGSTFSETVNTVSDVSSNLTLAYSASTNPFRPQTDATAPGTTNDWGAGASGKQAIRATAATLAPGESASFRYTANVAAGSAIDSKACNSVAVASDQTLASEPLPVCATTAEADLSVTLAGTSLQAGRPGTLHFTVSNAGASATAPAAATVTVPAGLTVTSFAPDGWSCTSSTAPSAPAVGPVTLQCTPVQSDDSVRTIADGAADPLDLPVVTTKSSGSVTVDGSVAGAYFDQDTDNNSTERTFTIAAAATALTVTKDDGVSAVTAGGQTIYTLTVQNPLVSEGLTGATISDTLPAGETFVSATGGGTEAAGVVTWALPPLAAGATASVTLTVAIAPTALTDIANTVTATVPDPDDAGATLTGTASDTDGVRAVTLTKSSDVPAIGVTVGDTITYTVTEKNVGSAAYTAGNPARIVDDLSGVLTEADFVAGSAEVSVGGGASAALADPTGSTLSWSGALPVGASAVLTYRVTVVSGVTAVANAAYTTMPTSCAAGIDADGLPCATVSDAFAPHLTIVKTATLGDTNGNGTADAGESIGYSFLVSNDGGTDATGVIVHDPKVTGLTPATADIPAGGSVTFTAAPYVVTQADIDAGTPLVNTATAGGTDTGGDALPDSAPSTATTPVTAAVATLDLAKTATLGDTNGNGTADAGETIGYQFVVTNTGTVTETAVSITDPKVTGITPASADIAPGATQTFTATPYVVTQADVDAGVPISNTATASGEDPAGVTVTSPDSTATVPVTLISGLTIVKTQLLDDLNGNGTADVGETISYGFTVTNTGNTTETGVSVDDPMLTGVGPVSVTLAGHASQVFTADPYTVTQADVDAGLDITNTATASGTDPASIVVTSDPSMVTTPITPAAPALSIVKSAGLNDTNGNGKVDVGETIAYSFVVTNTGNVTVTDVTVNDAKMTGITPAAVTLAPGEQQVFTADSWTAAQSDIDRGGTVSNTATAQGLDPQSDPVVSDPSSVVTPLADPDPELTIVKTASLNDGNGNGKADAGETIAYSFVVTNTGNVTMTAVSVTDAMVYGITPATAVLLPGQQETVTADDYTVLASDVSAGHIVNTATATGTDPQGGDDVSAPSAVTTPTGPVPVDPVILAFTGAAPTMSVLLAAMLLGTGAIVLLVGRTRRRARR